jgi:hypothetical protein
LKKIRVLSVILGFFYCSGVFWYGELFFSKPIALLLLLGSTGVALLIAPLFSDALLRSRYIRFLNIVLISNGIGGSLYGIGDAIRSTGYWWNLLAIMLQHIVIIFVLVILGIQVISARFEGKEKK